MTERGFRNVLIRNNTYYCEFTRQNHLNIIHLWALLFMQRHHAIWYPSTVSRLFFKI